MRQTNMQTYYCGWDIYQNSHVHYMQLLFSMMMIIIVFFCLVAKQQKWQFYEFGLIFIAITT